MKIRYSLMIAYHALMALCLVHVLVTNLDFNFKTLQWTTEMASNISDDHDQSIFEWQNHSRLIVHQSQCVIANFLRSNLSIHSSDNYERITLVLHVSSNYFNQAIVEQVDDNLETLQGKLSIHPFYDGQKICTKNLAEIHSMIETQKKDELADAVEVYPVNIARNIARKLSSTKFILIGDYEFVFSKSFERDVLKLAEEVLTKNSKTVLVFRIFESIGNMSTVPRTKQSLYDGYKNRTSQCFHAQYTGSAHCINGLDQWFKYRSPDGKPATDRIMKYNKRTWEPQFVSLTSIPYHDENFPYGIRDNSVLRWELCRLNYTFLLIHDHFMTHPGFKLEKRIVPSNVMYTIQKQFKHALVKFVQRMDFLYPGTKLSCPEPGF